MTKLTATFSTPGTVCLHNNINFVYLASQLYRPLDFLFCGRPNITFVQPNSEVVGHVSLHLNMVIFNSASNGSKVQRGP